MNVAVRVLQNAALPYSYMRASRHHMPHLLHHTGARVQPLYLPAVRSEWLAIWDADEYVFGPNVTVGSHLRRLFCRISSCMWRVHYTLTRVHPFDYTLVLARPLPSLLHAPLPRCYTPYASLLQRGMGV